MKSKTIKIILLLLSAIFTNTFSSESNNMHKNTLSLFEKYRLQSTYISYLDFKNKAQIQIQKQEPSTWGLEEETLEKFLKNIGPSNSKSVKKDGPIDLESEGKQNLATNKLPLKVPSENQFSETFKSVGPNIDSTVNNKGEKYSEIYDTSSKKLRGRDSKKSNSGFYGRSRLTRF